MRYKKLQGGFPSSILQARKCTTAIRDTEVVMYNVRAVYNYYLGYFRRDIITGGERLAASFAVTNTGAGAGVPQLYLIDALGERHAAARLRARCARAQRVEACIRGS